VIITADEGERVLRSHSVVYASKCNSAMFVTDNLYPDCVNFASIYVADHTT